jgi:hypothetical protein
MGTQNQSEIGTKKPAIIVNHKGRFANQVFQAMVAFEIASRVPNAQIYGIDIKEVNLTFPQHEDIESLNLISIVEHRFNLDFVSYLIKNNIFDGVKIDGYGMDLSHFVNLNSYKKNFKFSGNPSKIKDDELLISIRTGDILSGWHPKYFPLQFDFYEKIIQEVGLEPVFMGETQDSNYIRTLKNKFSHAKFLSASNSFMDDFETIRQAKNIVLSISSFAFLGAFFSNANKIHMPVAGLYDPRVKFFKANLLPVMDHRYEFYHTNFLPMNQRASTKFDEWFNARSDYKKLSKEELYQIIRNGFFK